MSNWVTLQNGVHIDLDDPNNPITGDGSFESYLGGGDKSSGGKGSGNKAFAKDMAAAYKNYEGNFHPDNDILYDLQASGETYGMSEKDLETAVRTYVKKQEDEYHAKLKAMPKTQAALEKDFSKWLNGHRDLIKYDKGPGGMGVNGKVMSDIRQAYLKDQFNIERDSYAVDYETNLSLSRAVSAALDYVWHNEIKEGKRK